MKLNQQIRSQSNKVSLLNKRINAILQDRNQNAALQPQNPAEQSATVQKADNVTQEDLLKLKEDIIDKLKAEVNAEQNRNTKFSAACKMGRQIGSRLTKTFNGWKNDKMQ